MKVIVTGTGRCGTVYMAKLLTSLGIPCGHESIFNLELTDLHKTLENKDFKISPCSVWDTLEKKKIREWVHIETIEADSSYMAAPFLYDPIIVEVPIIHVTRNPLEVVSSFILDGEFFMYKARDNCWSPKQKHYKDFVFPYEEFMTSFVPAMDKAQSPLERACRFYIDWTEMIENARGQTRKFLTVKIEDQTPVSDSVLEFLEVKRNDNMFSDSICNSWKKRLRNYKLFDIPTSIRQEFSEASERLGYRLS